MASLIDEEPTVILRDVLQTGWTAANITATFDEDKRIHTGSWSEENPYPEVTLAGLDEDRSPTGIDPGGKGLTSWVDGIIRVTVWVPNDRGQIGDHPRSMRWELDREIHRIIKNTDETTDDDGNPQLTRVEAATASYDVETTESPVIFRAIAPIGYQWHARP